MDQIIEWVNEGKKMEELFLLLLFDSVATFL